MISELLIMVLDSIYCCKPNTTRSSTKEKKKARKVRKEESSSKKELSGIETLDKDSNLGKE